MSNFAIMRHEKITSKAKLAMTIGHNRRTIPVPNADPDVKNHYSGLQDPLEAFDRRLDKLGIKPRANAVLAYELLFTYSPEMKGCMSNEDFFKATKEFLKREFPSEAILSVDMHLDETTPHIHAIVMPIIEKTVRGEKKWRLAAKDYTGTPQMLIARQTRFAEAMAPLGLVRGTTSSKAKHKEIKAYYGDLQRNVEEASKTIEEVLRDLPEKPNAFNAKIYAGKLKCVMEIFRSITQQLVSKDLATKAITRQLEQAQKRIQQLKKNIITSEIFSVEQIKELVLQNEKQYLENSAAKHNPDNVISPAQKLNTANPIEIDRNATNKFQRKLKNDDENSMEIK
jgi:hypothetical protein